MRKSSVLSSRVSTSSQNPVYTIIVALSLTNILLIAAIIVFFTSKMTNDTSGIDNAYFQSQIQQIKTSITKLSTEDAAKQPVANMANGTDEAFQDQFIGIVNITDLSKPFTLQMDEAAKITYNKNGTPRTIYVTLWTIDNKPGLSARINVQFAEEKGGVVTETEAKVSGILRESESLTAHEATVRLTDLTSSSATFFVNINAD